MNPYRKSFEINQINKKTFYFSKIIRNMYRKFLIFSYGNFRERTIKCKRCRRRNLQSPCKMSYHLECFFCGKIFVVLCM